MNTEQKFQSLCKTHHWRCTPQRLAVYAYMERNLAHPSVDAVHDAVKRTIPAITRESVYRILNEFADAGLLYRMDKIESAHYDSRMTPHGHLVCEKCGKVQDFELTGTPELPPGIRAADLRHLEVRYVWLCPECRKASDEER